jgi:hypothetical protein
MLASPIFSAKKIWKYPCQTESMGVERNCSSKSQGDEDDSTGLRTLTAYITPRTRCVPPEAPNQRAATAKIKALERGTARFPVLVFPPFELNRAKFICGAAAGDGAVYADWLPVSQGQRQAQQPPGLTARERLPRWELRAD